MQRRPSVNGMAKFAYFVYSYSGGDISESDEVNVHFNRLGAEGWELVDAVPIEMPTGSGARTVRVTCFFRRLLEF